jgi:desulfoferrodoxin (superoxide reductase-like protein)
MERASSRFFLASVFFVLVAILLLHQAGTAEANVPTVLQVVNISQGSEGRIRLEIAHSNPSAGHYVDMVEVQVAGTTRQFSLQPQSSDPFTVELDLGELQGTPDVRARAHCNLHGWSDWSQTIAVPEFPAIAIVGSILLLAMLLLRAGGMLAKSESGPDQPQCVQNSRLSSYSD